MILKRFFIQLFLLGLLVFADQANAAGELPAYHARFGREQAVIAVVAENHMTELSDYVVPYGVLAASGAVRVLALSTDSGPVHLYPAITMQAQATVAEFDRLYPQGADYVIVPAVHDAQAPALQSWVKAQAAKGAIMVGVCDGVWVLAHAGLLAERKAAGFWYSMGDLKKQFPRTSWQRDQRYVADGNIITTTGVTASLPVSLALVEAIAGKARAATLAAQLGVADWSPVHKSADFQLRAAAVMTLAGNWLRFWSHEDILIPLSDGINEIALALYADAWSRTYRSQAVAVSNTMQQVRSRHGLQLTPERVITQEELKPLTNRYAWLHAEAATSAQDQALQEIALRYSVATRKLVSLFMEYPRQSQ